MNISKRAFSTPPSAIRKLVPFADQAQKRGITVYHLNIGQPDLPTPLPIMKAVKNFPGQALEYAPSAGLAETISAWQEFYKAKGYPYNFEDINVTAGGSEGLIFAFFAVCDPGDEIMVFEPFYTSYAIIAAMGNINLKAVPTFVRDGFHLPDKNTIEKAITKKTKAVIICNPNNPTGTLYTDQEIKMIVALAKKHNLFIISDETYQEIVFDGKIALPFANFKEILDRLIIVDSVSKRFNSCGARVGTIVSKNKEIMQSVLKFAQGRLSVASVEQLAVIPLLINHKSYLTQVRTEYAKRRDCIVLELKKMEKVVFRPPSGAFYLIPALPIDDSDRFAQFLLTDFHDKKETLMIAPATGFYKTAGFGKKEIRIAYVLAVDKLKRAMELLRLALKEYNRN